MRSAMGYSVEGEMQIQSSSGRLGDYFMLLKPRVMSLSVFTALSGMLAAPGSIHPLVAAASLLCVAVGAGAAGAFNMWWDADIDHRMKRTRSRPLPSGRLPKDEASALAIILAVLSVSLLALFANLLAASLLALTIFHYTVIYSMWLKRRSSWNIVIGGAAGALPPMIGWAISAGSISLEPLLMFAVIFLWTPPHFWAMAIYAGDDFKRAGLPMLPLVAGDRHTRAQIAVYAILLAFASMALAVSAAGGWVSLIVAVPANLVFLFYSWRVWRRNESEAEIDRYRWERGLFKISIFYLFILFVALIADAFLRGQGVAL